MNAEQFVLRDLIERGLQSFDIPYAYLDGEVMEIDVPTAHQPLFNNAKTVRLGFGDESKATDVEPVRYGALVLDTLKRLLEGDRHSIGHALVAQRLEELEQLPEYKERLNVLNAPVISCEHTVIYRPIVRFDFRMRIIGDAIHSQPVPVYYDLQTQRVLDGGKHAGLPLQDIEEAGATGVFPEPRPLELSGAAKAAVAHIRRHIPELEITADGTPAEISLSLMRVLVLYTPHHGIEMLLRDRRTKREFVHRFATGEDSTRIAPVFCGSCSRIKTHYYMSHRTGELMCTDCGLLCVGCWDAYHLDSPNCDACTKRRYCTHCITSCSCGTMVCPDHQKAAADGIVYCQECEAEAPVMPEPATPEPEVDATDTEAKTEPATTADAGDETSGETSSDAANHGIDSSADAPGDDPFGAGPDPLTDDDDFGRALDAELASAYDEDQLDDDEWFSSGDSSDTTETPNPAAAETPTAPTPDPFFDEPATDDVFGGTTDTVDPNAMADDPFGAPLEEEEPPVAAVHDGPGSSDLFSNDDLPPPPDATGFVHEDESALTQPQIHDETPHTHDSARAPHRSGGAHQLACSCHGQPRAITDLHVDFLTGQYYCPDYVQPCPECAQPTAIDFLEGNPAVCFYCANKMPLNLDPEGEDVFRREVQPLLPFKYRVTKGTQIARSPHHLAYYIKPIMGKALIVYWDQWTSTVIGDEVE